MGQALEGLEIPEEELSIWSSSPPLCSEKGLSRDRNDLAKVLQPLSGRHGIQKTSLLDLGFLLFGFWWV